MTVEKTGKVLNAAYKLSYSKRTGLRSMQHVTDRFERGVIEAYKDELSHDVWGNPDKLREWVKNKIEQLLNKDYRSDMLNNDIIIHSRNELVKKWGQVLKNNFRTSKNPFLQLKILNFITGNLHTDNKALAPVFRENAFSDAIAIVYKTGQSFKKVYTDIVKKTKYHNVDVTEENVITDKVRGTWYHVKTLNSSETVKDPKKSKNTEEFIMSISSGSDWCIRNKHNLSRDYIGTQFHIFLDDKGIPQLCVVASDDSGKVYQAIKGKEQYKDIPAEFREILSKFVKERHLEDAVLKNNDGSIIPITDFCR